jgi:hypothetical protein
MSAQETPAEKVLQGRQLEEAMSKLVIERSLRTDVDGPFPTTFPGELLLTVTRQLCKESGEAGAEELTPLRIDRALEDAVINGNWGSFYWRSGKRHLRLNSPEWRERHAKKDSGQVLSVGVGDLSGVYGADSR